MPGTPVLVGVGHAGSTEMPRVGFRRPGAEIELQVRELEAGTRGPDPKQEVQDSPVGTLFLALLKDRKSVV